MMYFPSDLALEGRALLLLQGGYPLEEALEFAGWGALAKGKGKAPQKNCKKGTWCKKPGGRGTCIAATKTCRTPMTESQKSKFAEARALAATTPGTGGGMGMLGAKSEPQNPLGLASFASGDRRIKAEDIEAAFRAIGTEGVEDRLQMLADFNTKHGISISVTAPSTDSQTDRIRDALKRFQELPQKDKDESYELLKGRTDIFDRRLEGKGYDPIKMSEYQKIAVLRVGSDVASFGFTNAASDHVVITASDAVGISPRRTDAFRADGMNRVGRESVDTLTNKRFISQLGDQFDTDTETAVTVLHELGHQVKFKADKALGIDRDLHRTKEGTFIGSKVPRKARAISDYGSKSNPDEWFAESFALYMLDAKQYRNYDPVGHDHIEKMFKIAAGRGQ